MVHNFAHPRTGRTGFLPTIILSFLAVFGGGNCANAGIVSIWANDGSGWVQIATDPTGVQANVLSYTTPNGAFTLLNSYASMQDGSPSNNADLNSSTFHINHLGGGSDTLSIVVIGSNFTSPTKAPIYTESQVSGINSFGALTSLNFQSYVDGKNNSDPSSLAGGLGNQSPSIFPTITGPGADLMMTLFADLNAPFSVAQKYDITMSGGLVVSLGGDTALSPTPFTNGSVPEPSSIALIGICMTGLAGYSWRRRQQQLQMVESTAISSCTANSRVS
jgi:PEP-CTERM motif